MILTGTPHGVALGRKPPVYLADGDVVTVRNREDRAAGEPVPGGGLTPVWTVVANESTRPQCHPSLAIWRA